MDHNRFLLIAWKTISSLTVTVALLGVLVLQVVYGTLYQVTHGVYEAQHHVFNSWIIFVAGVIPLPGVKLAVGCLFINLLASAIAKIRRTWRAVGLLFIHFGIAVLFMNAALGYILRQESVLTLGEGETSGSAALAGMQENAEAPKRVTLPVTMHLSEFIIKHHPGSSAIMDYESHVHARGEGIDRDVVISMNRPFRYRDYTFYQSSYQIDGERKLSLLAVVKNPVRIIPYIASITIAGGLIIRFLIAFAASLGRRHG